MRAAILVTNETMHPNSSFDIPKRLYKELRQLGIEPVFIYGDAEEIEEERFLYHRRYQASDFDFYLDFGLDGLNASAQLFDFDQRCYSPVSMESSLLGAKKDWMYVALDWQNLPLPNTYVFNADSLKSVFTRYGIATPAENQNTSNIIPDIEQFADTVFKLKRNNTIVIKPAMGLAGNDVIEIKTSGELQDYFSAHSALPTFDPSKMILQQKIEQYGIDYRAYVVGGRVIAAIRRTAQEGEWRTNFSLGSNITPFELTAQQEQDAIRAMDAAKLGFGTVDIILDEFTGQHYICEVNGVNSGMRSIEIAHPHINVAAEVAHYLKSEFCPTTPAIIPAINQPTLP